MKTVGDRQVGRAFLVAIVKSVRSHPAAAHARWRTLLCILGLVNLVLLAGCNGAGSSRLIIVTVTPAPTQTPLATQTPAVTETPTGVPPSSTSTPSSTPKVSSTATASSTPTPAVTPTPVPVANNASVFAVDCTTQKAYVPMPFLGTDGNGEVAELNLSVDPDVTDPRVAVISTHIPDLPVSAAADPIHSEILVSSDNQELTGELLVIKESNNSLVSFPFPTGSTPGATDGVVYDPGLNLSLVSMTDALFSCSGVFGSCTGAALFNASTGAFTNFNETRDITNFAIDFNSQTSLFNALAITPNLYAFDLSSNTACGFSDLNLTVLSAEPDGVAADPATGIWVIGNFDSPVATVVNLSEGTFSQPPNCMLTEGGTLPNSVNFNTNAGSNMPGVAINTATHQALLTANLTNEVALLTLPAQAEHQLTNPMVSGVQTSVPNDPVGDDWISSTFPYAVVADTCHNLGYILDRQRDFLVQIDLAQFQSNPAAIKTALGAGHCAGTSTRFLCDNNKGVKFFPLPGVK